MKINILTIKKTNLTEFIHHWSKLYSYSNETSYYNAITKEVFELNDIQNLYVWKNGMKLSTLKQISLDNKIKAKLTIINNFKSKNEIDLA
ncbi:hypothetical protein, partial [Sphaerochaeta sp. S2]